MKIFMAGIIARRCKGIIEGLQGGIFRGRCSEAIWIHSPYAQDHCRVWQLFCFSPQALGSVPQLQTSYAQLPTRFSRRLTFHPPTYRQTVCATVGPSQNFKKSQKNEVSKYPVIEQQLNGMIWATSGPVTDVKTHEDASRDKQSPMALASRRT